MKIPKYYSIVILICICSLISCSCTLIEEESTMKFYQIEMFSNLVINESTLQDVQVVEPEFTLIMTSFGAVSEFPTENGQYIRIEFVGSEMVVGSIELVDAPWGKQ